MIDLIQKFFNKKILKLNYYMKTEKGQRDKNEDYLLTNSKDIFVLCDGVGGEAFGEIASEKVSNWFIQKTSKINSPNNETIKSVIQEINNELIEFSHSDETLENMSTTLVSFVFYDSKVLIHNVGDSRAYLLRGNRLIQVTDDQTPLWSAYKNGKISKNDMLKSPIKNIISQAIGTTNDLKINGYKLDIRPKDIFLLCSDGLHDYLTDNEIKEVLQQKNKSQEEIVEELISNALEKKSKDNISIILIEAKEE